MTLAELQPYLAAVSAGLSVATLALILNIVKTIRDNALDRIAIQEERIRKAVDDHQRLEQWADREKTELKAQLERAKADLDQLLKKEGIDLDTLALGKQLTDSTLEVRVAAQALVDEMKVKLAQLTQIAPSNGKLPEDDSLELSIAMGAMASGSYSEAATHFDVYATRGGSSWQAHFSRAVAHANSRLGEQSDTAALMAYNDAIALSPRDLESNQLARLFAYRGAMLKRLHRLAEAQSDLTLALTMATAEYERLDIHYNLACVYAMRREGDQMFIHLAKLAENRSHRNAVAAHLSDYFVHFRSHPDLKAFIEGGTPAVR